MIKHEFLCWNYVSTGFIPGLVQIYRIEKRFYTYTKLSSLYQGMSTVQPQSTPCLGGFWREKYNEHIGSSLHSPSLGCYTYAQPYKNYDDCCLVWKPI